MVLLYIVDFVSCLIRFSWYGSFGCCIFWCNLVLFGVLRLRLLRSGDVWRVLLVICCGLRLLFAG